MRGCSCDVALRHAPHPDKRPIPVLPTTSRLPSPPPIANTHASSTQSLQHHPQSPLLLASRLAWSSPGSSRACLTSKLSGRTMIHLARKKINYLQNYGSRGRHFMSHGPLQRKLDTQTSSQLPPSSAIARSQRRQLNIAIFAFSSLAFLVPQTRSRERSAPSS